MVVRVDDLGNAANLIHIEDSGIFIDLFLKDRIFGKSQTERGMGGTDSMDQDST